MNPTLIKLTFISGLQEVVLKEIAAFPKLVVTHKGEEAIYLNYIPNVASLRRLRSVLNVFLVKQDKIFNPKYISNHKSILGDLVATVIKNGREGFSTFKLSCAGADSPEVVEIKKYLIDTFKLVESDEADIEIYIGKNEELWEVGVRLSARPLSLRDYKVENIKGGLNPTIAFAINSFCNLAETTSYLNAFSGSATLLIEAGLSAIASNTSGSNTNMRLLGFDTNGKSIAQAVKNIKKAGLIKQIELKNASIFDKPDFGTFDTIVADLPFGMQIGKDEDLEKMYGAFLEYGAIALSPNGMLVAYTTEADLFEKLLSESAFIIKEKVELKVSTVIGMYIYPKIFVCKRK